MSTFANFLNDLPDMDGSVLLEIDFTELENFGLKDSRIYRAEFERIAKNASLSKRATMGVIFMGCMLQNRDRAIKALKNYPKLAKKDWVADTSNFLENYTSTYVSETTANKFPFVNISSAFAPIAGLVWTIRYLKTHTLPADPKDTAWVAIIKEFLSNLWAAQFDLDSDLRTVQKTWEVNFWTNTVTKSKSKNYMAGFHESFYDTKKGDKATLMTIDGTGKMAEFLGSKPYNSEKLIEYFLGMGVSMAPVARIPPPTTAPTATTTTTTTTSSSTGGKST